VFVIWESWSKNQSSERGDDMASVEPMGVNFKNGYLRVNSEEYAGG
jgi:ribulose bisphosphate carboxylase small subunit